MEFLILGLVGALGYILYSKNAAADAGTGAGAGAGPGTKTDTPPPPAPSRRGWAPVSAREIIPGYPALSEGALAELKAFQDIVQSAPPGSLSQASPTFTVRLLDSVPPRVMAVDGLVKSVVVSEGERHWTIAYKGQNGDQMVLVPTADATFPIPTKAPTVVPPPDVDAIFIVKDDGFIVKGPVTFTKPPGSDIK